MARPPCVGSSRDQMAWQVTASVAGVTLGRRLRQPQLSGLLQLMKSLERRRTRLRSFVLDASRLEGDGAEPSTLDSLREAVLTPLCSAPSRPHQLLLIGTRRVGQLALLGAVSLHEGARWAAHAELEPALRSVLGTGLAGPLGAVLSAINNELTPRGVVSQVRAVLGENPRRSLPQVAHELGQPTRTLQRNLAEAATTFVHERTHLRLELAADLLNSTEEKVELIAREVGYASLPRFIAAFRGLHTENPAAYRARRSRGRQVQPAEVSP